MAYFYRLAVAIVLYLICSSSSANTCIPGGLWVGINEENTPSGPYICRYGCKYVYESGMGYITNGESCVSDSDDIGGGIGSGSDDDEEDEKNNKYKWSDFGKGEEFGEFDGYSIDSFYRDGDLYCVDDYNGSSFCFSNYSEFLVEICDSAYWHDEDRAYYETMVKSYCENRYGATAESEFYSDIASDYSDFNYDLEEEEVDVKSILGTGDSGSNLLSTAIPDLLSHKIPNNSGSYGSCLKDLDINIMNYSVTLHISRVCPWLDMLGKILIFISLFVSIQIIVRD